MMKAKRIRSPFQQVISKPSEHHRRFERMTMDFAVMETTLPASGVPGEEHAVLPHEAEVLSQLNINRLP